MRTSRTAGRLPSVAAAAAALAALVACSGGGARDEPPAGTSRTSSPVPAEPSAETPSPDASVDEPERVTLTVVGDIMLGRRVAAAHADPTATLQAMRPLLRRADLTVGNLENTLSTAGPATQGGDSFSASPRVLRGLADAGFDALSLANNHAGDHGSRALVETVRAFEGSRVRSFGAGRGLAEALRPAVLEVEGTTLGLLGFNAIGETPEAAPGSPGALSVSMPPRTGPLDRSELRRVLVAVRRLARRVDAVVVLPHWGTQYTHVAEPVQSVVGRRLIDAGAALVVGGHPHWVQGYERHGDGLLVHSLGNFVFDMDFMPQTMEGVVLTATFEEGRVVDARLTPYRMDAGFTPRPLRGADARDVLADVRRHSRGRLPRSND
jgi:poly-gamma-glutamate capsule biosynthesis protein CapA/YwtB (metallophosphatase superfamily)